MSTGVWFVGARGSVAVTTMVGACAVRAGLAESHGCVLEKPEMRSVAVPALDDLVFGGYDVVTTPVLTKARELAAAGVVPAAVVPAVEAELQRIEKEIGVLPAGRSQAEVAEAFVADLRDFADRNGLDRVVVINVANTEPPRRPHSAHDDLTALQIALNAEEVLPPSSLAAYSAFTAECAFVDFTPSTGARLPALDQLASERGVPYAGNDGKTGETLLRSVLAPMFAARALRVNSWSGANFLGGGDGLSLAEPGPKAAKTASKQRVLGDVLGYEPEGHTNIDHVADLGDFKTSWDLVTFSGFLGTRMRLQFTWEGCDSALAAPLVLDLARLMAAAHRNGISGPVREMGFFFKDPIGSDEHSLLRQWDELRRFAETLA